MGRRTVSAILDELRGMAAVEWAYVTGGKSGYDVILKDGREIRADSYRGILREIEKADSDSTEASTNHQESVP